MKKKLLIPGIEINHSGNPYKQVILTSNLTNDCSSILARSISETD